MKRDRLPGYDAEVATSSGDTSDASGDADASDGPGEGECRTDSDCTSGPLTCLAPGEFIGCGVCQQPPDTCEDAIDCMGQQICRESVPKDCLCDGSAMICDSPCEDDSDCETGESCMPDGRCDATSCTDSSDCPEHFECASDSCSRRSCSTDSDCPSGVCVDGACHGEYGQCSAIPA